MVKPIEKIFLSGYQGGASRGDWTKQVAELAYGKELKAILSPGNWRMGLTGFGEI